MTITLRTTKGSELTYQEADDNWRETLDLRRAFTDQVTAGGTADIITADFTRTVALVNGVMVKVKIGSANTVAGPTLNVNATGAKTVTSIIGTPIPIGGLPTGAIVLFSYDSGIDGWVAINSSATDALTLNSQPGSHYLDITNATGIANQANLPDATEIDKGIARIATAAEATAGVVSDAFLTPATGVLASAGAQVVAVDGYVTLPGGVILQWGQQAVPTDSTAVATFPIPFPNAIFNGQVTIDGTTSTTNDGSVSVSSLGLTSMILTNGGQISSSMYWTAIGN